MSSRLSDEPAVPPQPDGSEPGVDALLDPARQLTSIEKAGFFFAPPYHEKGLAAAVFAEYHEQPRAAGRLVVHKRIIDPSHASRRFERGGFTLQILDAQNQPIPNSQFATDSNGRGICPVAPTIGPGAQLTSAERSAGEHSLHDAASERATPRRQPVPPNTPYGGA